MTRRAPILAALTSAVALTTPAAATAAPYLHAAEARASLTGSYGSDDDVGRACANASCTWSDFSRNSSVTVCQQVSYRQGGVVAELYFLAYYPRGTADSASPARIYDKQVVYCDQLTGRP